MDKWYDFLSNWEYLSKKVIDKREEFFYGSFDLLKKIIADLNDLKSHEGIVTALENVEGTDEKIIGDRFIEELDLFNTIVSSIIRKEQTKTFEPLVYDQALNAGKTIINSLIKLFKLPGWLNKLLTILNETVTIIKGN